MCVFRSWKEKGVRTEEEGGVRERMVRKQKQGLGEGPEAGRGTDEKQPVVHRHSRLGCLHTREGFGVPMSRRHWGPCHDACAHVSGTHSRQWYTLTKDFIHSPQQHLCAPHTYTHTKSILNKQIKCNLNE